MKTILDLHNIYYSYHTSHGETRALSNLSFSLAPGEFAAVVGPSGCGKSTLLSLICGLMKPQTGEILLNGEPVLGNSPQIGYMLQHDHLFEWRTIYRNILLGPEISHTLNKEIREKAKSMLTQYGLKSFIHARPSQLSGGMRQRAALIRTLLPEPELLLLDEPFSALDYQTRLTSGIPAKPLFSSLMTSLKQSACLTALSFCPGVRQPSQRSSRSLSL